MNSETVEELAFHPLFKNQEQTDFLKTRFFFAGVYCIILCY